MDEYCNKENRKTRNVTLDIQSETGTTNRLADSAVYFFFDMKRPSALENTTPDFAIMLSLLKSMHLAVSSLIVTPTAKRHAAEFDFNVHCVA